MIDAYQASTVAVMTDGGIYHLEHFWAEFSQMWEIANEEAEAEGDRPYGWVAEQRYNELKSDAGLHSVIRYSIHEMESENAWEIERYPEYYSDDLVALLGRRDALRVALANLNDSTTDPEAEDAADVVEDMLDELDHEIEEMIDSLSKVTCDECGEPIE